MDHLDGRYGYITLEDALAGNWRVFDYESDDLLEQYDSFDRLIDGG